MSLTNLKSPFSTSQWDSIKNYISNQIAAIFNPSNTESGTSAVEINATSGVAVFDDIVDADRSRILTINNSNVTANTILWVSLKYDNGSGTGKPLITNYWTQNNTITVEVYNLDSADTASDISIAFQIVG
jgi:hypothetical protein